MRKILPAVLLIAVAAVMFSCKGAAGPTGADGAGWLSMSFQEGALPDSSYTGAEDNRIWSGANAAVNYSTNVYLQLGYSAASEAKRALIRFDISAIPYNATIQKATLTMFCDGVYTGSTAFALYKVITHTWVENQSTWNNYATASAWTTAGGNYDATALGADVRTGTVNAFYSWDISKAAVQDWLTTPANNRGMIMKSSNEATQNESSFYSAKSATIMSRPKLTVYYTLN